MLENDPALVRKSQIITVVTILVSLVVCLNWSFIVANLGNPAQIFAAGIKTLFPHGILWLIVLFAARFALIIIMGYEMAIVSLQPFTSLNWFTQSSSNFFEYLLKYANLLIAAGTFIVAFILAIPL